MPHKTLAQIAKYVDAKLVGDANVQISAIAPLANAIAGDLSFIVAEKYLTELEATAASAVIIPPDLAEHWSGNALVTTNPYLAYAKAAELFNKKSTVPRGIHPSVVIGDNCTIAENVYIAANVVIGNNVTIAAGTIIGANTVIGNDCEIGENCEFKAHVTVCDDVHLGKHCIVHSGAILGCDGFGNANDNGVWHKIPQLGGVRIADDVEIGANTTIDCGTLGDTIIGTGVRIDNLVQIAHNVVIGAHTAIAACCGIAGSTEIGQYCMLAGQVGVNGHIKICDHVILTAKAMVTNSIDKPGVYSSGTGIMEASLWRKSVVHFRNLDKIVKKIKQLGKT